MIRKLNMNAYRSRCVFRLFSCEASVDILDMMNEYLDICEEYPVLVFPKVVCQHLKNMVVRNARVCVFHLRSSRA